MNPEYGESIVAAILAHEIAHIFIFFHGIEFDTRSGEKKRFQEQMTDLSTIALGLGKIYMHGNTFQAIRGNHEIYGSLGYPKNPQINYAQKLVELIL